MPTHAYGPGEMAESDWSPYMIDLLDGQRRKIRALSYVPVKCILGSELLRRTFEQISAWSPHT
jgi:hypothetical protein